MNAKKAKKLRKFISAAAMHNENVAPDGYVDTCKINYIDNMKEPVYTTSTKVCNPNSERSVYQRLKRKRPL